MSGSEESPMLLPDDSSNMSSDNLDRVIQQASSLINSIYHDLNNTRSVVENLRNYTISPPSANSSSRVSPELNTTGIEDIHEERESELNTTRIEEDVHVGSQPTHNYCETIEDNPRAIDMLPASLSDAGALDEPDIIIVESALTNPRRTNSNRPTEIIDLVNVESTGFNSRRTPFSTDEVIDLCTPPNPSTSTGLTRLNTSRRSLYNNNDHTYFYPIPQFMNRATNRSSEASTAPTINDLTRALARLSENNVIENAESTPPKVRRIMSKTQSKDKLSTTKIDDGSYKCPVCFEKVISREPTTTRCGHVFCNKCINMALRETHKCPLCNAKLNKNQVLRIYL